MLIKVINHSNPKNLVKAAAITLFTIIIAGTVFIVDQAHTAIDRAESEKEKPHWKKKLKNIKNLRRLKKTKIFV